MGKSARKKPRLPKANPKAEEEPQSEPPHVILSSDDEADDDLSLKIVEKAMLRASGNETNGYPSSSSLQSQVINAEVKKKRKMTKVRKKDKIKAQDNAFEDVERKEESGALNETDAALETKEESGALKETDAALKTKEESGAPNETDAALETNPTEKSDNSVLRKLLRGPRYFDPPDSSWQNCYNCGEGGHTAANCTSAKRKKPCFVCGSLEHNVKQCDKGKDCFICNKGGHRAKDCPEKSIRVPRNAKICLKCGDSGHDMLSCKSIYSPDDLKEIQCYVCKCFGHLCCVNYADAGPREVSCYRCGQLGHSGWECARLQAEATSTKTPSSCYKCGEGGHIARKCPTSAKKEKRKGEFSSPRKSHSRDNYGNNKGTRSVPHDLGNARKKNRTHYAQPSSSQPKPKSRGGWTTEHPGDYDRSWGSPKTPVRHRSNDRFHGGSGYHSGYHNNGRPFHYENTVGTNGYHHRFSASRFGNSSNYGKRDYSWDY